MIHVKSAMPPAVDGTDQEQMIAGEGEGYRFAHISDPHLSSLEGIRFRDLLNKRLLGYLSWRSHRREEHRTEVLAALLRDLATTSSKHTVITGDLTHLGLPAEFREVARWLPDLGTPQQVTVIPGNHETYVEAPWKETFEHWLPYLSSDAGVFAERPRDVVFPSLRVRDQVAFIGLSSARPSAPFLAVGSLGMNQLQALDRMLAEARERQLFRVLLIHHPPLTGTMGWRKRLTDSSALQKTLERQGVELVLHGHAHRATLGWLETSAGRAPVIGVPSASAIGHKPGRCARYNICRVWHTATGWNLEVSARAYSPELDRFVSAGKVLESPSHRQCDQDQDGDARDKRGEQGVCI
jgi:3',5'-cyclic AMP phosphodiesterase CpdA